MQYALAGAAPSSSWLVRVAPHDLEISNCSQALRAAHFSCPPILFSYSPLLAVEGIANLFTILIHKALCSSPVVSSPHTWRSSGRWFLHQYLKPNLTSSPSSPYCVFSHLLLHISIFLVFSFLFTKKFAQFSPILKNKFKLPTLHFNSCSISLFLLARFGRCSLRSLSTCTPNSHPTLPELLSPGLPMTS